ncbi:MAG TPA: 3'(2'),5'-bisphosphate nucleotidase [Flavobacteriales bacterium]|nr:3'(2'),5'-bisphosphate nucleotidase [Flavobacteriales bacterium]
MNSIEVDLEKLLMMAQEAALKGGEEILKVYHSDRFEVEFKGDQSPLTLADRNAHVAICDLLSESGIPILSEEGKEIPYKERKNWNRLWIVDPLDGTKEFIKRNGEFTVNIALIENGKPILGVIYVPVKDQLYTGAIGIGAQKKENGKVIQMPIEQEKRKYRAVGSRSHMSVETEKFFDDLKTRHGEVEIVSMGSSLKICLVAEGTADVYPRFAPTMEWDTAAGHAIAGAAGKSLIDVKTNREMVYNREDLLNNWFVVS